MTATNILPWPLKPKRRQFHEGDVVMMRDRRAVVTMSGTHVVGVRVDSPFGGTYDTFVTAQRLRLLQTGEAPSDTEPAA